MKKNVGITVNGPFAAAGWEFRERKLG